MCDYLQQQASSKADSDEIDTNNQDFNMYEFLSVPF